MRSRDFCYWLQGYFELHGNRPMRPEPHDDMMLSGYQVDSIRKHLALVFKHEIDPSAGSAEHQTDLDKIHSGAQFPIAGAVHNSDILYRC